MSKKLRFAFLASILANVLLIGVLLGQLPHRFDRGSAPQKRMDKAVEQLPEPGRTQFRQKLEHLRGDIEPLRKQIREARGEAIRIWTNEPFDEAAYDRQVNKITELRVQMGNRMAEMFKEAAKDLPPDQRRALAEMLKRPPSPPSS